MNEELNFSQAASQVKNLSKRPDNETLLRLYSLFKQGSDGDARGKRPGMIDFKGRAKWDSWNQLKGMSQDEAQQQYVSLVGELISADS